MATAERFTAESRALVELALREALSLGHNYIGPEHLLLALTRQPSLAARALERVTDHDSVRRSVIDELTGRCPTCGTPGVMRKKEKS